MLETIGPVLIGAFGSMIAGTLYAAATRGIKRRVEIRSPDGRTLDQLVPAVNAILEVQGPQLEATIVLLECTQGTCNGNVKSALDSTRKAHIEFTKFLNESARVKVQP